MKYTGITRQQLGVDSPIKLEIVNTDEDLLYRMAFDMYDAIAQQNQKGENTVLIVPVGPAAQYRRLAEMINRYRLSLQNTYIFNMDEYLDENKNAVPVSHPLSFRGVMLREFYDLIDAELNVPEDHRFFPTPENVAGMYGEMQRLGGVDVCFGGIGINGHVAFNEPPEPDDPMSDEDFCALGGRIQKISRETRTINSTFSTGGVISEMPEYCVTLGMKEIIAARRIRLYLCRAWQSGITRRVLHGPPSASAPVSLLQNHPDIKMTISESVAKQPVQC